MTHAKHHHEDQQHDHRKDDLYWKRAHRDWKFWIALTLMLAGMMIYIITMDEALQPEVQPATPTGQTTP